MRVSHASQNKKQENDYQYYRLREFSWFSFFDLIGVGRNWQRTLTFQSHLTLDNSYLRTWIHKVQRKIKILTTTYFTGSLCTSEKEPNQVITTPMYEQTKMNGTSAMTVL